MTGITVLGILAAVCTSLAFLPQVIQVVKTKSTHDISLAMFLLFCLGVSLWLTYGLFIRDIPVIAANVVTLVLAGIILIYKLRYR